jgi:GDP-D-mannose dehydratase
MAEVACRLGGLDPEAVLEEDPSYARPNDIPSLVASTARLNALGWRAEIPFETLVRECLEHDLAEK